MKFVNLTPHEITEVVSGMKIPPSGKVARVSTSTTEMETSHPFPLYRVEMGEPIDLPEPQPDTVYIVSLPVKSHPAVAKRQDVWAPGDLVRDEQGRPIGCRGFKVEL